MMSLPMLLLEAEAARVVPDLNGVSIWPTTAYGKLKLEECSRLDQN
jgi:hypothetical protein